VWQELKIRDWREGMREVIATFTAAGSASYYERVGEMGPALFERVRDHVASDVPGAA
jgi:hypothetical protein